VAAGKSSIVICAGGGGIPTMYDENRKLKGVEAVIDKDLCSALLAEQLEADLLIIATDVDAAYIDWGKPTQKAIAQAHPDELERWALPPAPWGRRCRQPASSPAIPARSR
jgi:carbamate kinase